MRETYAPQAKTATILNRALEIVQSVDYKVSARWLFYRLLQEGHYSKKVDYSNKFLPALSAARKAQWEGWRPDTLADETRQAIRRGNGFRHTRDWIAAIARGMDCNLDYWHSQDYYVELWFEARAMISQFEHYTELITLRPMGGEPSIPYKYEAAKALEFAHAHYNSDLIVLYFGDMDPAGNMIAQVVERDVQDWCEADIDFIHCGLTLDQVKQFDVPENPDKPGEYQWEALSDDGARSIITENTNKWIDFEAFDLVTERATKAESWFKTYMESALKNFDLGD